MKIIINRFRIFITQFFFIPTRYALSLSLWRLLALSVIPFLLSSAAKEKIIEKKVANPTITKEAKTKRPTNPQDPHDSDNGNKQGTPEDNPASDQIKALFMVEAVAFVDMNRLLQEGFYGKRNYKRFINEREAVERKARNRRQKIDRLVAKLETLKVKLNQNQIGLREEEIEFLRDELKQYLANQKKKISLQQEGMMKYFLRTIDRHIRLVAKREQLLIIFDKLPVYYAADVNDITDLVLESIKR